VVTINEEKLASLLGRRAAEESAFDETEGTTVGAPELLDLGCLDSETFAGKVATAVNLADEADVFTLPGGLEDHEAVGYEVGGSGT